MSSDAEESLPEGLAPSGAIESTETSSESKSSKSSKSDSPSKHSLKEESQDSSPESDDDSSVQDQQCEQCDAEPELVISVQDYILQQARDAVPLSYKSLLKFSFEDFKGEPITVIGWARSVRKLKRGELLFVQLYDGKYKFLSVDRCTKTYIYF